jgi:hypothetical protein
VTSAKPSAVPDDLPVHAMLAKLLDPFLKLAEQQPSAVQPGSVMNQLDDALGQPFLLSHAVAGAQVKAVDHFVASGNLIFKAGVMHPWAALTLVRGALESAATAAWLLSSTIEAERLRRCLRLNHQDLLDQIEFETALDADAERIAALRNRRGRLLTRATDLSLDKSWVAAKLSWQAILDTVGRELQPKLASGLSPLLTWQLLSGVTHGRQWASLTGLEKEIVTDNGDGTVTIKQTTNEAVLYVALATAAKLFKASSTAYENARLAWRESPPPGGASE